MRAFYSQRVTKKRMSFDSQKNAPAFFSGQGQGVLVAVQRRDTPFGFFISQFCALIFNDLRNKRKTEILRSPPFPMQIP